MGKLFNSMIMGLIITIALALFNASGVTSTSLILLLLNPNGWDTGGFWLIFSSLTTLSGVIVIGIAAIIKQDWVFRAGIVLSLSSIVLAPFVDFFNFLNSQVSYIGGNCTNATICSALSQVQGIGQFIAVIIAGPLLFYALWSCIEWVFTGDKF